MPRTIMLVVASILVAGCGAGGSDASDAQVDTTSSPARAKPYEATMRDIHGEMNSAMSMAFASQQLDAKLVRAARTTAEESLEQMEEATAPRRYRSAHVEYAAGLKTFAEILADVERQVDEPDVARRHLGDKRFATGVAHLEKATKLYDDAGLDLDATAKSS